VILSQTKSTDFYTISAIHYDQGDIVMNPFVKFMASKTGRITRVVAGAALIAWGLLGLSGTAGIIVAVVGLVPLLAGLFDVCVFAPLFRNPFRGPEIRGEQ
jgi:hypothetical protein